MSPPIVTDGPMMAPERGIHELTASFGQSIGATASESWSDSPLSQLMTGGEIAQASGQPNQSAVPAYDEYGTPVPSAVDLTEQVKPAIPRMDIIEANDRVKKAGLDKHLTLPDQPDMPPAQLAIMMRNAQARAEREATIERGPQGFIPSALQVGTSFLVGAADPINVASAFIPVMGELRYGKVLAAAGDSLTARLATRAAVGGAQGAVGQAALEPLDWWAHTQEGRDFGMSDVLHNIMFGAALGGGLHAGGGFISDAYRGAKGRALYPFGPGEPLEERAADKPVVAIRYKGELFKGQPGEAHLDLAERHGMDLDIGPKDIDPDLFVLPGGEVVNRSEMARRGLPESAEDIYPESVRSDDQIIEGILAKKTAPPSPAVAIINDLPPRAHEDAMRVAISDLINGEAVRSGDVLEAGARADPRIAESLDIPKAALHLVRDDHLPGNGDTVSYSINGADGSNVGYAEFIIDGDTARVLDVASFAFDGDRARYGEVRNSIGARQLRELLDQFRELHPEVKKLTADRVSGARKGGAYDAGLKANEIEVRLAPRRGGAAKPDRAQTPESAQVVGFTTAKGSTYEIGEGGVTSRNKAARSDVGHEGDEGLKPASEKTVYADPSAATALAIPQNAKWKVIDHGDGTISLATRNDDGKWGIAPSARNVAVTDHPREGLLPIELWKREEVNGLPAYGTVHFGNEIVALKRSASEGASAAPARDVPTSNLDKAAAWRGIAHVTPDFDTPEAIAASKAAAEVKPPKTKLDERVTAAEKAEAYAKSMYDMFAHRLPEQERVRLEEHIAELERNQADRDTVSQRGAACLFEGRGA